MSQTIEIIPIEQVPDTLRPKFEKMGCTEAKKVTNPDGSGGYIPIVPDKGGQSK